MAANICASCNTPTVKRLKSKSCDPTSFFDFSHSEWTGVKAGTTYYTEPNMWNYWITLDYRLCDICCHNLWTEAWSPGFHLVSLKLSELNIASCCLSGPLECSVAPVSVSSEKTSFLLSTYGSNTSLSYMLLMKSALTRSQTQTRSQWLFPCGHTLPRVWISPQLLD